MFMFLHTVLPQLDNIAEQAPFGLLKLGWNWLKHTVLAEMLWEKNIVPAEKEAEQAEYRVSRTGPLYYLWKTI